MDRRRSLAWMALVFCCLAAPAARAQDVEWRKDYAAALREASTTGRPLYMTFTRVGCSWCTTLEFTTYRDPAVVKMLSEQFVPMKVEKERYPSLIKHLGITKFPTLLVAAPEGKILDVHDGYLDKTEFAQFLTRAVARGSAGKPDEVAAGREDATRAAPAPPKPSGPVSSRPEEGPTTPVATAKDPVPTHPAVVTRETEPEAPPTNPFPTAPPVGPAPPAEPAWMPSAYTLASEAFAKGDTANAVAQLKELVRQDPRYPTRDRAVELLREIERQGSELLYKVKEAETNGRPEEALELAQDLMRRYQGTPSGEEAANVARVLAGRVAVEGRDRQTVARGLMFLAREDYRLGQWLPCLLRCEEVLARYSDLPDESNEANELLNRIKRSPERMLKICDSLPEVLGQVYLATAETKILQGEPQQAVFFLERVLHAFPNSKHAEMAQVRLSQIQGPPGVSEDERKP